jgi:hypothetical protein
MARLLNLISFQGDCHYNLLSHLLLHVIIIVILVTKHTDVRDNSIPLMEQVDMTVAYLMCI